MSSVIHGIRILDKKDRTLTFKTYLIYSDWESLPRTHGFGFMVLMDKATDYKREGNVLQKDVNSGASGDPYYYISNCYDVAQKYVTKMEVSDFANYPVKPEFLESTWHYLNEKTGDFHSQEHLPSAIYTMEVTDSKWLEHVHVGDVWESTSADFGGPSWYLEFNDGKSHKFYHLFQDDMGSWKIRYGKANTAGRVETPYMHHAYAESKVNEKLKKGYKLIYRNFDTPYGFEESTRRAAEKEKKESAKPVGNDEMMKAVDAGDVNAVKQILESGFDLANCVDKYDSPLLEQIATGWNVDDNQIAIARLLLEHGADPDKGNYGPFFPELCYSERKSAMVPLMLEFGADITLIGGLDKHSVVQCASSSGMISLVKDALAKGVDVMHRTVQGHTALHYAANAEANSVEIMEILLAAGADVHDMNGEWGTPFFWAATKGSPEAIRYLIKSGADLNAKTPKGKQAIHECAKYGSVENFKTLLELGADLTQPDSNGIPLLHILAERVLTYSDEITENSIKKIELLHEKGIQLNVEAMGNTTTGQLFSKAKSKPKLQIKEEKAILRLLELGLHPSDADPKGFSMLHFAAKINHDGILEASLSSPVPNLNGTDESGWTALHYAACHKDGKCTSMLIEAGADQAVRTRKKKSFLKKDIPASLTAKEIGKLF